MIMFVFPDLLLLFYVLFIFFIIKRAQEWIEVLEKLSPCFHHAFFYPDCTILAGQPIKDLGKLNRPLENVIHISSKPSLATSHPDNSLFIQAWDGHDKQDKGLLDLYLYLQRKFHHQICLFFNFIDFFSF